MIAEGRAHSSSRLLRCDVAEGCCDKVLEESSSRHAELNLTDCANAKIDKCFEGFAKDVGDGGIVRSNTKKNIFVRKGAADSSMLGLQQQQL